MSARNKTVWLLCGIIVAAASFACVSFADVTDDERAAEAKALLVAAQSSYSEGLRLLSSGNASSTEEVYLWSRRVMEAEIRAGKRNLHAQFDAAVEHENRMREVERTCSKLMKAGMAQPKVRFSTKFYLLEAKTLVLEAKHG